MAKGTGVWQAADAAKHKISTQAQKRIQKLYTDAYKDIVEKSKALDFEDQTLVSVSMKRTYYNQMQADLLAATDDITKSLNQEVTGAALASAKIPVQATQAILKKAGLALEGAFSSVPTQVIENLVSGKLYKGNWNLSSAIWKAGAKTKSDIQELIAKGLAENLSTAEISKSLEQYLLPSARKPWDWRKVYPGTAKKVDYNAQRLARTMIQHSYQQSLIQTNKDNPWCDGIIWHSAHSSRVCAICAKRDGQVFPVLELPLDHPNGMCFFEPATADLSKIADDLANWVNTGSNKKIDKYLEKAYGYKPTAADYKRQF